MSFKTIINLFVKLGKWIKDNIIPLFIGGAAGGAAVAVVAQEQKKKAVVESYKKGCKETALAYEKKLAELADKFLAEKELVKQEYEKYEELLCAYELEIVRLEKLEKQSKEDKKALRLLMKKRGKLSKIKQQVKNKV